MFIVCYCSYTYCLYVVFQPCWNSIKDYLQNRIGVVIGISVGILVLEVMFYIHYLCLKDNLVNLHECSPMLIDICIIFYKVHICVMFDNCMYFNITLEVKASSNVVCS